MNLPTVKGYYAGYIPGLRDDGTFESEAAYLDFKNWTFEPHKDPKKAAKYQKLLLSRLAALRLKYGYGELPRVPL